MLVFDPAGEFPPRDQEAKNRIGHVLADLQLADIFDALCNQEDCQSMGAELSLRELEYIAMTV